MRLIYYLLCNFANKNKKIPKIFKSLIAASDIIIGLRFINLHKYNNTVVQERSSINNIALKILNKSILSINFNKLTRK